MEPKDEAELPEAGRFRRDLPRRHTISGSRPVLRHSDAMDLDSNKSSSDSERSGQSQQRGYPPAKPERRSFPIFSGGRANSARQQQTRGGYMPSPPSSMFDD
ncbi:uncharacterized protein LOC119105660, partial [Pollicipes pollicipes]|uniref:uncharacterized protein LOC119105660 n=1 Tax=Pollicipes pollicipes TaxID=41117 RepID=UPI0018851FC4